MIKNECRNCEQAKIKNHGLFDFACIDCCARLVASARPSRVHQESMFCAIERFKGAPSREEVLDCIKKNSRESA